MIQIDMPMPENCRMCPVCSEYDICLIPVDGKGFGEQNVSEFTEGRPKWCPLKEQKELVRCKVCNNGVIHCENGNIICDNVDSSGNDTHPADWFCADGERK